VVRIGLRHARQSFKFEVPMARRAGKAANRKARQRYVPRTPRPAATAATPIPPVGTPDAREASALNPPRRTAAAGARAAGSQLSSNQRAEYHYVERDLRNIGILTAVMAAMLVASWFVFNALGLVS
jgi:hypothetical protein